MNDCPFSAFAHLDRHGVHHRAAVRRPITGFNVDMLAGQAVRAVVAMVAARTGWNDLPSADFADEWFVAGVCFVVTFVVLFSLVLAIHGFLSSKK